MTYLALYMVFLIPAQVENHPVTYEEVYDQAVNNCIRSKKNVDKELIKMLIKTEQKYGVPPELRGMILAAVCHESGFNPKAKGDWKFSKDGKRPKAIGLFQMWPWWESKKWGYGINRRDPKQAAEAFMKHIVRQLKKTKKTCRYKTARRRWIAAWVTAIRSPKKGGRCREKPLHLRVLHRWHRQIKRDRLEVIGC
jgi:hypothetical protein